MNIEIKSTSYLIPNNSSWESLHKDNKLKFAVVKLSMLA